MYAKVTDLKLGDILYVGIAPDVSQVGRTSTLCKVACGPDGEPGLREVSGPHYESLQYTLEGARALALDKGCQLFTDHEEALEVFFDERIKAARRQEEKEW